MRYFSYIAEQAFKTDEHGRRLFFKGGPWSRPYIIPDLETESRLLNRRTWMYRLTMGPLILGQPFLFMWNPQVVFKPSVFLVYLAIVTLLMAVIDHLAMRSLLSGLQRSGTRLPMGQFYLNAALKHSPVWCALGLLACLSFVAGGAFLTSQGFNPLVSWLCIVFFGLCSIAWAYILKLRLAIQDDKQP